MITKETTMCTCQGVARERATYYCLQKDIIANGDGTYSIPGITGYNADLAFAMDSGLTIMCDGESGKWYEV